MNNYLQAKKFTLKGYNSKLNDRGFNKIYPSEIEKKERLEETIKEEINKEFFSMLQKTNFSEEDAERVRAFIVKYLKEHKYFFQSSTDYQDFVDLIVNDIFGLGVLQGYINDPEIEEINILGSKQIYIERHGKRELSKLRFKNDTMVVSMINKILAPINRKVDEANPKVDARLQDGSRVAVTLPPVALNGPEVAIRKFMKDKFTLDDYVHFGQITPEMKDFLSNSVKWGANILVVGGTSSGKTTFLNALTNEIPNDRGLQHVITIEDSAELQVYSPFWQAWETKNPNSEGKGGVNSSDLVKHSLRNSPDRIIVGEIRDKVAYDVLQASITGHKGCMSTIHADDAKKAGERFCTLAGSAGVIEVEEAKKLFASSFDLIVVLERLMDPRTKENVRYCTQVCHVVGTGAEAMEKLGLKGSKKGEKDGVDDNRIIYQDIYRLDKKTMEQKATGYIPKDLLQKAELEYRPYDLRDFEVKKR